MNNVVRVISPCDPRRLALAGQQKLTLFRATLLLGVVALRINITKEASAIYKCQKICTDSTTIKRT